MPTGKLLMLASVVYKKMANPGMSLAVQESPFD